jgi:hypothetical protein
MPRHDDEPLVDRLVQVVTDTLSDELDVLVSTDDDVYEKVVELSKLCSQKFYAEDHLDTEGVSDLEYHGDMDDFPAEEE